MGLLDNPKYELLAQEMAKGSSKEDAYIKAGYATKGARANMSAVLRAHPEIEERVKELQERAALRAEISIADVQEMLMEDRKMARDLKQVSAAIRAAELLGKQCGMFVDRKEIKVDILEQLDIRILERIIESVDSETARRIEGQSLSIEGGTED